MKDFRKMRIAVILAICFSAMELIGYQIAMMYGTTVHTSAFFQRIGVLGPIQCAILFFGGMLLWTVVIWWLFGVLDKHTERNTAENCAGKINLCKKRIEEMLQKKNDLDRYGDCALSHMVCVTLRC